MPFSRIFTQDYNLQKIQDNVASAFKPLEASALSNPSLVKSVYLKAGQDNIVSHLLGQAPQVWIVCGLDTNTVIWSEPSIQLQNQSSNDRFINLKTSANCKASLLFA